LRRYLSQLPPRLSFSDDGNAVGRGAETMFELSDHATIRCEERKLPDTVLECIQRGTFIAQALEDDGRISNLHIVRVATDHYWVAIERDAVVVTVILVGFEGSTAREWFSRRLLNYRHVIEVIESLPVTSTQKLRRLREFELRRETSTRNHPRKRDRIRSRNHFVGSAADSFGAAWGISA
jgi:hypothetical protein